MRKVILVIHGMRTGQLNETLLRFTHSLFEGTQLDYDIAFLESETRDLNHCIKQSIDQGYRRIQIVPLLLFTASHYFEDIIEMKTEWQSRYPNIHFQLAKPLGTHDKMETWVRAQIENYQAIIDDNTAIVVLAHGNKRFEEPDNALKRISNHLTKLDYACFSAMVYGDLNFKATLPPLARRFQRILVIPYFFYDGFLVNRTKRQIEAMQLSSDIVFTSAINFHPILKDVILARIHELEEASNVSDTTQS
ncbi:sirohydrochlorin chelatase [Staphylococcus canis]|uniref:sirohydrochlorin chelatase n=1 Tax=Staphylococcus canis TaxID=2724942 RepID=UPI0018E47988|nr:sirohydrochlorin chelatase [Staphylococcus canis]